MKPETCEHCGIELKSIGETGKNIQECDMKGKIVGEHSQILYQCPCCMRVVII